MGTKNKKMFPSREVDTVKTFFSIVAVKVISKTSVQIS